MTGFVSQESGGLCTDASTILTLTLYHSAVMTDVSAVVSVLARVIEVRMTMPTIFWSGKVRIISLNAKFQPFLRKR
jgi:hypothetical protein